MKKLLRYSLTLIFALVASVSFAATYTYSFADQAFKESGETVDLGGIEWTATTDAGYFGSMPSTERVSSLVARKNQLLL